MFARDRGLARLADLVLSAFAGVFPPFFAEGEDSPACDVEADLAEARIDFALPPPEFEPAALEPLEELPEDEPRDLVGADLEAVEALALRRSRRCVLLIASTSSSFRIPCQP